MNTTQIESILFSVLVSKGFVASCALDMSQYIVKAIQRPNIGTIADHIHDVDAIIAALRSYKVEYSNVISSLNL